MFIAEDNVVKLRLEMLQYVLEMSGGPLQRSDVLYFKTKVALDAGGSVGSGNG